MKKIITIGREYGAAGSTIGRKVAEELGIAYYDRDLILKTAEASSHLTAEDIRKWDEKVPREYGIAQSLFNFYARPLSEQIWNAQVEAIRKTAEKESCVIVGRNADYILRGFDHTLRVFIYADKEWRIQHMCELQPELSYQEVEAQLQTVDKARRHYCKHYTGQKYGFAGNYDLSFNVSRIGIEKVTKIILDVAKTI